MYFYKLFYCNLGKSIFRRHFIKALGQNPFYYSYHVCTKAIQLLLVRIKYSVSEAVSIVGYDANIYGKAAEKYS
jgi:hypothetical protein